jgi:quercetin dioxygenase-like cupin family protein
MVMRRVSRHLAIIVTMVIGVALGAWSAGVTHAQDATPASGEMQEPEGVTFTPLGIAPGETLQGATDLTVARAIFAPGAGFPLDVNDPEGALVIIESGALTFRVEEQGAMISRGAAMQQMMATPMTGAPDLSGVLEQVAKGQEATLQAGDVTYIPGNITGEVRNTGQEPASVLLILTDPAGTMLGGATPQATPAS